MSGGEGEAWERAGRARRMRERRGAGRDFMMTVVVIDMVVG